MTVLENPIRIDAPTEKVGAVLFAGLEHYVETGRRPSAKE